jgi:hypothetical protein
LSTTNKTYGRRKLAGLCVDCGGHVETNLKNRISGKKLTMCRSCLNKNAVQVEAARLRWAKKGFCKRCGKERPSLGRTQCDVCTAKCSRIQKTRINRTFFDKAARRTRAYSVKLAKDLCFQWKRQRGRCALTGRRLNRHNACVDHRIPKSRGGTNEIFNLRWLHKSVNQAKHALLDEEFVLLCQEVVKFQEARI